jgi:hypothetical protein
MFYQLAIASRDSEYFMHELLVQMDFFCIMCTLYYTSSDKKE